MKSKETRQKTVKAWAKNDQKHLEAKQTDMLACRPTKACTKQNSKQRDQEGSVTNSDNLSTYK